MYKTAFFALIIFFINTNNSYAYLDPGTGSMLLQIIAAVSASIFIFLSLAWYKIKSFFYILKQMILKKNKNDNNDNKE
tara:strand:+ start:141 stop:374 length:234 start_codon:yes stop_codon:yes gene_type:complete